VTDRSASGFPAAGQDGRTIDTSRPNIARVYDYWLGGKENFAVDREVAGRMLEHDPDLRQRVRDNRAFVTRVAGRAAEQGITQFIDLGAGLPAHPSVHEAARAVSPRARVVYVDNDPVVISHARALLAKGEGLAVTDADLRDPGAVFADLVLASAIDLSRPVCIICAAVAHFLPAAQAAELAAQFTAPLAAGSWLAISFAHFTDTELLARLYALHTTAPFQNHGSAELASFVAGLDLMPPGIAEVRRWLSGIGGTPKEKQAYMLCGVGVKGPS
jgi:O-methyltransferase involved in polyketide biosynthesis